MSRVAYVNGLYVPQAQAGVSIEDRGYQFADGVYEVIEVDAGTLVDEARHLSRLTRSLGELRIAAPLRPAALAVVLREVMARNRLRQGFIYLQVTRGVARRDHPFPDPPVKPALVVTARAVDPAKAMTKAAAGIRVFSMPDTRWKRPDIKTIALIANVLSKQEAKERGGAEAWLLDADAMVTEGSSSNAWIVTADKTILTHPVTNAILQGVTRTTLLSVIETMGYRLDERRFSLAEAYAAEEAFITGATTLVTPVIAIDDKPVGTGRPGPIALALRHRFHDVAARTL